ncbi:hypothetical protein H9I52_04520 [Hymenobacter sp. BT491]|nr:hypothetical protein [Hymenobacter sp. BT491]
MGELGLRPAEFWALTWNDYDSLCYGHCLRQQQQWEHTRLLYAVLYNQNAPKGKTKTLQELLPLSLLDPPKPQASDDDAWWERMQGIIQREKAATA